MRLIILTFALLLVNTNAHSKLEYALAMHGVPKYGPKDHFAYVNPKAPIGGELIMAQIGSWDSFNPFITKGNAPQGLNVMSEMLVFERLMERADDEPFSLYPLLAESIEMPADRSAITFNINPAARWADGKPVTAKDVIFSHATLKEKGMMNLRIFYSRVDKVEELGPLKVKFSLKKTPEGIYDPELPLLLGLMVIIPKHIFEGKDFENMTKEPVIGSGPYKVVKYDIGKFITYERRPDYWGWKLPKMRGLYNFKTVRFNYFLNDKVAFEDFKSGGSYVHSEGDPKMWYTAYDFKAAKDGRIKRCEVKYNLPVGMQAMAFNTRREKFQDERVRRAISHLFDFKWINTNLLHGHGVRTMTFFDNCELTPTELPTGKELEILNRFKDKIPPHVFTTVYKPASEEFNGDLRANLRKAISLLSAAGWTIKNNKLVNKKGEQFKFEIILYDYMQRKIAINFANTLRKKLGIDVVIRNVDIPQYQKRQMTFDYDMIFFYIWHSLSPGREQMKYWSTQAADEHGSRNYSGMRNPVIDQVCHILATAADRETLVAAAKALGRLLNWELKVIETYHQASHLLAHSDKIDHPPFQPDALNHMYTWWSKQT